MELLNNDELQHWGVQGMKWGVRRYQNKDGTLTPAGKKRYDKEVEKLRKQAKIVKNMQATKDKIDKIETKRKELNEQEKELRGESKTSQMKQKIAENKANKPKSVKEMTDDELSAAIARMKLEESYNEYMSKRENKETVSKGQKFVSKVGSEVLAPAATDVAKQLVKSMMVRTVNKTFELEGDLALATNNKKK